MAALSLPFSKTLLSWRTLAILFALLNLKSIPFSWHIRLFYHFFSHIYRKPYHKRPASQKPRGNSWIHPIFTPQTIHTRSPLLESDYNLHKSNSTYFSDLDLSRATVTTGLYSPGLGILNRELDKDGFKGRMGVILGSVFCSFRREIKPYQGYYVQSRVLGWDEKWLYIGSWFLKEGGKKEVLASALSKYVIKKGRYTVAPERALRASGYLPEKPSSTQSSGASSLREDGKEMEEGVTATTVPEAASTVLVDLKPGEPVQGAASGWDYERIDRQRLRGLEVAKSFQALDGEILDEFERDVRAL